jgi:IS5 family transposase
VTIIEAASSTKNKAKSRDPEMHQTKTGNQWFFGLKAHIGVDAKRGLVHSFTTTSANEHDLNQLPELMHGEESFVSADSGYRGVEKREETKGKKRDDWLIAEIPSKVRELRKHPRINKLPTTDGVHKGQYQCESRASVSDTEMSVRIPKSCL